jgi:hypothetical protein
MAVMLNGAVFGQLPQSKAEPGADDLAVNDDKF